MKPNNRKPQEQIEPAERAKLKVYEASERLRGIGGESGIPNLAEDTDEIVFGKNGVWRGMTDETD